MRIAGAVLLFAWIVSAGVWQCAEDKSDFDDAACRSSDQKPRARILFIYIRKAVIFILKIKAVKLMAV